MATSKTFHYAAINLRDLIKGELPKPNVLSVARNRYTDVYHFNDMTISVEADNMKIYGKTLRQILKSAKSLEKMFELRREI